MHFMIASLLLLGFNAKSQRITDVCVCVYVCAQGNLRAVDKP